MTETQESTPKWYIFQPLLCFVGLRAFWIFPWYMIYYGGKVKLNTMMIIAILIIRATANTVISMIILFNVIFVLLPHILSYIPV